MNTQDHVPSLNYGTTSKQLVKSTPTSAFKDVLGYKTSLSFFSSLYFSPQWIYFSIFPFFLFWISVTAAQHGIWLSQQHRYSQSSLPGSLCSRFESMSKWGKFTLHFHSSHNPFPWNFQLWQKKPPDNKTNQALVFCTSLKSNQKEDWNFWIWWV